MQFVCSAIPANWATGHSLGESYPSAEMQLTGPENAIQEEKQQRPKNKMAIQQEDTNM